MRAAAGSLNEVHPLRRRALTQLSSQRGGLGEARRAVEFLSELVPTTHKRGLLGTSQASTVLYCCSRGDGERGDTVGRRASASLGLAAVGEGRQAVVNVVCSRAGE